VPEEVIPPVQRLFRYEAMWETHQDFSPMVEAAWAANTCTSMHGLERKLKGLSGALASWGRETFGSIRKELKELRQLLTLLRSRPDRISPSHQELKVVERLVELQHREEIMWKQRSCIQWLAEGDRNTKFFHMRASRRKKKNRICRLTRQDGSVTEDLDEISLLTWNFYTGLYTSEGTSGMEEVLQSVPVSVTPEMNDQLMKEFRGEEVKQALFQMFPLKAPGPDGYPAQFFQKHWDLCGTEVTAAVLRILRGEESPEGINKTFIVLIPKVASPEELGQFRPISLCNVIYKIASKVLANRLKVSLRNNQLSFQVG
jgi:hypothetical protein